MSTINHQDLSPNPTTLFTTQVRNHISDLLRLANTSSRIESSDDFHQSLALAIQEHISRCRSMHVSVLSVEELHIQGS
jgi:hypothetical protein